MPSGSVVCPVPLSNSSPVLTPAPCKQLSQNPGQLFYPLSNNALHDSHISHMSCVEFKLSVPVSADGRPLIASMQADCVLSWRETVHPKIFRLVERADYTQSCSVCANPTRKANIHTRRWGSMSGRVKGWPSVTFFVLYFCQFSDLLLHNSSN